MSFSSYLSSFWATENEQSRKPQRNGTTRKTTSRTQHIEIIGGGNGNGQLPPLPPIGQKKEKPWRSSHHINNLPLRNQPRIIDDAKLPTEIRNKILLIAAHIIINRQSLNDPIYQVLDLCTVDRSTHRTIFSSLILPKVTLSGYDQVRAFSNSLQNDGANVGLEEMASRCVNQLHVKRSSRDRNHIGSSDQETHQRRKYLGTQDRSGTNDDRSSTKANHGSSSSSLYDSILNLSKFENSTLDHLRYILSTCKSIKKLSLGCTPLVLDPRWRGDEEDLWLEEQGEEAFNSIEIVKGLDSIRENLEELVCLQNLYGGDLNEELWRPSLTFDRRWSSIKRLQLHGPRFRFTFQLAQLLGNLKSLQDLGLIMPLIPKTSSSNSIFQTLVDSCHQLKKLLIVGHDIKHFVGFSKIYSVDLHCLRRKWNSKCSCSNRKSTGGAGSMEEEEENANDNDPTLPPNLTIQLVTARINEKGINDDSSSGQIHCHPTIFSDWMLERSQQNKHWNFEESGSNPSSSSSSVSQNQNSISHSLETWICPFETVYPPGSSDEEEEGSPSDIVYEKDLCLYCKKEGRNQIKKEKEEKRKRLEKEERDRAWDQRLRMAAIENRRRAGGIGRRRDLGEPDDEDDDGLMGIDNLAY